MKLEPLQLLQTCVEALEAVVTNQEQHHQEMQDVIHHVETA
jgi:hypothetical protein